jgi:hypothetical protein
VVWEAFDGEGIVDETTEEYLINIALLMGAGEAAQSLISGLRTGSKLTNKKLGLLSPLLSMLRNMPTPVNLRRVKPTGTLQTGSAVQVSYHKAKQSIIVQSSNRPGSVMIGKDGVFATPSYNEALKKAGVVFSSGTTLGLSALASELQDTEMLSSYMDLLRGTFHELEVNDNLVSNSSEIPEWQLNKLAAHADPDMILQQQLARGANLQEAYDVWTSYLSATDPNDNIIVTSEGIEGKKEGSPDSPEITWYQSIWHFVEDLASDVAEVSEKVFGEVIETESEIDGASTSLSERDMPLSDRGSMSDLEGATREQVGNLL